MNNPSPTFGERTKPAIPALALRARDAAAALSVSERTLWDMTRRGKLPHVRFNTVILYPVKAIEGWLLQAAQTEPSKEGGNHETH